MTKNDTQTKAVLLSERIFDAPPEAVWRAWTEPELFMRWWGPSQWTSPSCQMDVRPGGRYLWCMRDLDGNDYYSAGVFHEVVPFERLVYSDSFADAQGNILSPTEFGMDDSFPETAIITLTFEDLGGRTRLRATSNSEMPGEDGEMAKAGWNQSMDKLAASLPAAGHETHMTVDRDALVTTITRAFDAPPALVWRALTEPELLARWWARGNPADVTAHELRPGGVWRLVEHAPDGTDHAFRGEFREIEPPHRLVQTFEYEPFAGHVLVETLTLTERDGGTLLTTVGQFSTLEDLEGMVQPGMLEGVSQSYRELDPLLKTMAL